MFLEAARRLGVEPNEAAIVEDAIAGVEAGRRGGFALVVGVDRTGHAPALRAAGADVVVGDPAELLPAAPADPGGGRRIRELPFAVDRPGEVLAALAGRRPAVFLDYDGTLTPIVARPEEALLSPETRAVVERLAAACPVAVVSGRDLADVRRMVALDGIAYAGSHGFDILRPDGSSFQRGREYLPDLDAAEAALRPLVEEVPGARVERKTFAIAVHVRNVEPARVPEVEAAVARVAAGAPRLRRTGGKKVEELRPDVDWDKGTALEFLIDVLGLGGGDVVPIYVGDDQTDEDAFRALGEPGIGVVVRGEDDDRPTHAGYALRDADETRRFLEIVAAAAEGARG
jgi:alpha,alpha-trehalase